MVFLDLPAKHFRLLSGVEEIVRETASPGYDAVLGSPEAEAQKRQGL